MSRFILPLAAIGIGAAGPVAAAEIQLAVAGPVIELTVNEGVPAEPDIANISAGVTTLALSAQEAMTTNAAQMNRVVERIEALGIERRDIQTSGIMLQPEYEWDQATNQQRFRGYRVANRVSVKLRAIERTGAVLDELVAAGATDIGGIGWELNDPAPALDQARAAAFATARQRALRYAAMAGFAEVRVLEISEAAGFGGPMPMVQTVDAAARAESTPVRPGMVEAQVAVTVKFEMLAG